MPEGKDYTIGWICAVHTEYVAAQAFLDDEHDSIANTATHDNNHYTLGRIGHHNVVVAVLPHWQYGLANATAVLKDMVRTFSNLRVVLMVGIGGGVPTRHDIRLGDVVVGSVGYGNGGVIQHDYGHAFQGKSFKLTGHLNQPPMAVQIAMNALRAKHERKGHNIEDNVRSVLRNEKRMQKKYRRPDASSDRLYKVEFVHAGGEGDSCVDVCGDDNLVHRAERADDEDNPAIHYGLIASGNTLMKDASLRDRLATETDVLCFEMEAAGLMNHFPSLVVRGICDYSDSHKNSEWQGYAALTAAAYAKELLLQMAPSTVEKVERMEDSIKRSEHANTDWQT
jgi:nucleoside phosphorylase